MTPQEIEHQHKVNALALKILRDGGLTSAWDNYDLLRNTPEEEWVEIIVKHSTIHAIRQAELEIEYEV